MSRTLKKIMISDNATFNGGASISIYQPITSSIPSEISRSLEYAIENNHVEQFGAILKGDFIYKGDGLLDQDSLNSSEFRSTDTYQVIQHDQTGAYCIKRFEYRQVRPIIEALFFEHNALFRNLVAQVAASDNSDIHKAFVDVYSEAGLSLDVFSAWDEDFKKRIKTGVADIAAYGDKLLAENEPKGDYAKSLASKLDLHLEGKVQPEINDSFTSKVKWLNHKYQFISELNSHNQHFVRHRGCKRLISNLASIIFSVGILNLINYCVTGNFLFFNKTTTQELVTHLGDSIQSNRIAFNS